MQFVFEYESMLGKLLIASDGERVTGLWFVGQKYFADNLSGEVVKQGLPVFRLTKKWLDIYFSGTAPDFTPPLSMAGASPFKKRVLEIMLKIPFGQTMTYGEIAACIECETGKKASAQAVGGAVGHNQIGIIIPCHRVMGANKKITGYAAGIDKKLALLKLEGIII